MDSISQNQIATEPGAADVVDLPRMRDTSGQDRLRTAPLPARRGWVVAGVVILIAVVFSVFLVAQHSEPSVSAKRLTTAVVVRGPFVRDISGDARIVAATSPILYAPSAGSVALQVHAGDSVKRDQLLAIVSSPELSNRVAQEKAVAEGLSIDYQRAEVEARKLTAQFQESLRTADIDLDAAKRELVRVQKAFAMGIVPSISVDAARDLEEKAEATATQMHHNAQPTGEVLKFGVASKKNAFERQALLVQDTERQLEELNVRSPVDGQVGQVFVPERATVGKDAQLVSVVDLSALQVELKVPEGFAREIAVGMPGDIQANGQTWKGIVSAISPEVVNGQVAARLRFDEEMPRALRQNQRVSVRVLLDQRDRTLTVTRGPFADGPAPHFAYVLHDGRAIRTPFQQGAMSLDQVEIINGLNAGDRVIIAGSESLHDAPSAILTQ